MNIAESTSAERIDQLVEALSARGALLEGHFALSSGRHAHRFVQKFRILEDPALVTLAATELIAQMQPSSPSVVVSAAVGGIVLGYEVARQLGVHAIFAEKENGAPVFRRGFLLQPSDRAIVVEDVVTTGGSLREVLSLVTAAGASIAAAGVIVQRAQVDVGTKLCALIELPLESYTAEECPACAAGIDLQDPGSRRLRR